MGQSLKSAQFLIESRIADAARGDTAACFDLGIAYSTGTGDVQIDMIEAHKWFNLAAMRGDLEAQQCRADVAEELTGREIAEAQKQARAFLMAHQPPVERRYAA
jgi:TPR repeat protein